MKLSPAKWGVVAFASILVLYVGSVIWFEARLGYNQPENNSTIVIATFDDDGNRAERVVRLTTLEGTHYIAANHWPRAWYSQALENPNIEVKMEGGFEPYQAVPLAGDELAFVEAGYPVSFEFKFRTGFPPRRFMRLDAL